MVLFLLRSATSRTFGFLGISGSNLSGPLPGTLGNLTNLRELRMGHNQLSASLPAALGNLRNLEFLDFKRNKLAGSIPNTLGNLSNLKFLQP